MALGYLNENSSGVTEFNLKTTNNPSTGKGGSRNGDSGGRVFPGFNPQGTGQDYSYRLNQQAVLEWITDPNREDAGQVQTLSMADSRRGPKPAPSTAPFTRVLRQAVVGLVGLRSVETRTVMEL